jgi:preprotein translocase subunit SecD
VTDAPPGSTTQASRSPWLLMLVGIVGLASAAAFFALRSDPSRANLDAELVLDADFAGGPRSEAVVTRAARVLQHRLEGAGIPSRTEPRGFTIHVFLPSARRADVQPLLEPGQLRFQFLVGDRMTEFERNNCAAAIEEAKAQGTFPANKSRYESARWGPGAYGGTPGELVLLYNRTPGSHDPEYVEGDLLEDAYRALDAAGRTAVGFTFGPEGRKQFYKLTSENVGRQLGVVLDGVILTAPTVRGAIGKKGIIEGGKKGWSKKRVGELVSVLRSGPLPVRLVVRGKLSAPPASKTP